MATMGPPPPLNKQKQKQEEEAAAAALDLYPDPNSVEMSLPVPLPPSLVQLLACCKQMQLGHKEDQKGEQRRILYSSSEYKDHLMDDLYLLPPPEKWDQREVQEEDFATAITEGGHHLLVKYGNFPGKLHQIITLCEVMGRTDIVSWCAHGRAFKFENKSCFLNLLAQCGCRGAKIDSFMRQLNHYGFRRLCFGRDKGAYYHECFLRGRIDLTAKITSTRSSKGKKSNHLISSGSGSGTQQQLQTSTGTGSTPPQKKKFGAYALKAEPNFYHIPPVPKYGGPDLSTCIELVQVSVKDEAHVRATKIVEKVKPVEEEEDEKKEQEKTSSIKGEEENTPKTLVAKVDVDAAVPAPANSSKVACGNNITKVAEVTKKDMPGCDKGNTATKKRNMTKKASSSASKKAKRIATIKKAVGMLKSAPKESAVTMVEKRNDAAGKKEEVPVTPAGKKEIVLPTPSFAREHSLFLPGQNADVSNFSKHVMPQLRLVTPEKPGPKDPFILHAGCNGYHPSALLPDFDESSTDADYPRICFSDAASLEEENDDNEDMLTLSDLDAMLEHLEPSSGLLDDTEGGILSAYEGNDLDHHNSSLTSLLSMNYSAMQSTEIAESVSFMNYGNGIGGTTPCFPSIAPSPSTHNGCSGSSPAYRGSGYNLRISKRSTGMTSIYTDDVTGWVDSSSKMEL